MGVPTAANVASFLGRDGDTKVTALAGQHLPIVTAMAATHTRDNGFTAGAPDSTIEAVIVAATARLTNNPGLLVSETIGDYSARYTSFQGWSIIERAVLDSYRRKSA